MQRNEATRCSRYKLQHLKGHLVNHYSLLWQKEGLLSDLKNDKVDKNKQVTCDGVGISWEDGSAIKPT